MHSSATALLRLRHERALSNGPPFATNAELPSWCSDTERIRRGVRGRVTTLAVTGPTGVGKSTLQRTLIDSYDFWTPTTVTTRDVEPGEFGMEWVEQSEFEANVRAGAIVLPSNFAGAWYGWSRQDFEQVQTSKYRTVLNVRPYTALLLGAVFSNLIPVWLTLPTHHLSERRRARAARRDSDPKARDLRIARDIEDESYEGLFAHVLVADDDLVEKVLQLCS